MAVTVYYHSKCVIISVLDHSLTGWLFVYNWLACRIQQSLFSAPLESQYNVCTCRIENLNNINTSSCKNNLKTYIPFRVACAHIVIDCVVFETDKFAAQWVFGLIECDTVCDEN